MTTPQITLTSCPQCSAYIETHPHFVTWCRACNWNLSPYQTEEATSRLTRLYEGLGKRSGKQLFSRFKTVEDLKPRWTLSKAILLLGAALVHVVNSAILVLGIYLIVRHFPNIFALAAGAILLAFVWSVRPRFYKLDDDDHSISRQDAPELYNLTDRIADAIKAKRVDQLVVNDEFNATFSRIGWQRKRTITIGLPLWTILSPQERVALLGHEIGHNVNGDSARSLWVAPALDTLSYVAINLRPSRLWEPHGGLTHLIGAFVGNLIALVIAQIAWLILLILVHLVWRDQQRAEYLADHIGASVGGSTAMQSALDTLHFDDSVEIVARRVALNGNKQSLFPLLRDHVASIPAFERERLHKAATLEHARLDTTHPPTAYRFELLQTIAAIEPMVVLSASENQTIDQELARYEPTIQQQVSKKILNA